MTIVHWYRQLNNILFEIVGDDLVRPDLFNTNTKIVIIDPTVFSPSGTYSEAQVIAQQSVFSTDYIYPAAKQLDSVWAANGWNINDNTAFLAQLKTWADNNLNTGSLVAPMGYNLKMSRIEYIASIVATYNNSSLIGFSYDPDTGVVTYDIGADLSNVVLGNYFKDGAGRYFEIVGIDTLMPTAKITIREIEDGSIPTDVFTEVNSEFDGSIYDNYQEPPPVYYTVAFFYMGNQGTPL